MTELASLTALGGVRGDTHGTKEIHQVFRDGVYDWVPRTTSADAAEDLRPRYLAEPTDSGAATAQRLEWLDPAAGYPEGQLNETILVWTDSTIVGNDYIAGTLLRARQDTAAGIEANWVEAPRMTDYVYDDDSVSLKPLSHQQIGVELRKIREVVTTPRIAPVGTRFNAGAGPVKFGARVMLPPGTERYMKPDVDIWMRASLVSLNQNMLCEVWPAGADHGDIAQRIAVSDPVLLPNTHERSYPFTFAEDVPLPDNLTQVDIVAVMHDRTAHRYGVGAYVQAFGRAISINAANVITVAPGLLYGIGGVTFEALSLKGLPGGHVPEARVTGQVLMATGTGIEDHEFADLPVSPTDAAAPLDVARTDYGVAEAFLLHIPAVGDYVDIDGVELDNDSDAFFLVPGGGAAGIVDAANPTPAEVAQLRVIEGPRHRSGTRLLTTAYKITRAQMPPGLGGEAAALLAAEMPADGVVSTSLFLTELAADVWSVGTLTRQPFVGHVPNPPVQLIDQDNGVLVQNTEGAEAGLYHLRAGVLTPITTGAVSSDQWPLTTDGETLEDAPSQQRRFVSGHTINLADATDSYDVELVPNNGNWATTIYTINEAAGWDFTAEALSNVAPNAALRLIYDVDSVPKTVKLQVAQTSGGEVRRRVAFNAGHPGVINPAQDAGQIISGWNAGANQFDTAFNEVAGVFTCPVEGLYAFSGGFRARVNINGNEAVRLLSCFFNSNVKGNFIYSGEEPNDVGGDQFFHCMSSWTGYCQAGERISLWTWMSYTFQGANILELLHFSGALLDEYK